MQKLTHLFTIKIIHATVLFTLLLFVCIGTQTAQAALVDDFVTTWKTDNSGPSGDTSIRVPMEGGPYEVDWNNDGIADESGLSGSVLHDFGVAGTYTIRISGAFDSIRFAGGGDKDKIVSLDQWGTNAWTTLTAAFSGAGNLTIPATDTPDFSVVKNMSSMFTFATVANPDTSGWDTAAVTTMWAMFAFASTANPDTSNWDTSAVTDMSQMFNGAGSANPDTSGWDTKLVSTMSEMFRDAVSFDQDIGSWNVTALKNAANMFRNIKLSTSNYDSLLIGWNAQNLQQGVFFFGGNSNYCAAAAIAARENMIASDSWTIFDGGHQCPPDLVFSDSFESGE